MNTTRLMCIPLYNDMASVYFGLYENEDKYKQFALFVVNLSESDMFIFSSVALDRTKCEKCEKLVSSDWIKEYDIVELSHQSSIQYIPYIFRYDPLECKNSSFEWQLVEFIRSEFANPTKNMKGLDCIPLRSSEGLDTYIIVFGHNHLDSIPKLVASVSEEIVEIWKEFYSSNINNMRPPSIQTNVLVESRFPDKKVSALFRMFSTLSALDYEKAKNKGTIALTNSVNSDVLVSIDNLAFSLNNVKHIRKLLELSNSDTYLLVCDAEVYGIGTPKNYQYLVRFNGHLKWEIFDSNNEPQLRSKHGLYYLPVSLEMKEWYIKNRTEKLPADIQAMISKLLLELHATGHGTILIISDEACSESDRLCGRRRGIAVKTVMVENDGNQACRLDTDSIIRTGKDVVPAVSSIDGAIFIDLNGNCYSFGIILDGDVVIDGTPSRGSRYNSTKNYVARRLAIASAESRKAPIIYAIIISDDGYIDIFSSYDSDFEGVFYDSSKE